MRRKFRDRYIKGKISYVIADLEHNNIDIPRNRNIKIKVEGKNNIIKIVPSNDDIPS